LVVFARISAKKSELIGIEENRTKLFLETEMLWQSHDEPAERTLHGASAEGSIAGVADRTKNIQPPTIWIKLYNIYKTLSSVNLTT